MAAKKVFVICGEQSTDLHASNIIKLMQASNSNIKFYGTGGDLMAACGVDLIFHIRQLAYIGYWEVLVNLFTILMHFKKIKKEFLAFQPDLVLLVDYAGFNLSFAKFVKKHSSCPVIYLIPPSVWAWKRYRLQAIKQYVDHNIVIFPFEYDFFTKNNVPCSYFGNPIYSDLASLKLDKASFRKEFNIPADYKIIAVLLGSRDIIFKKLAPIVLPALSLIQAQFPKVVFIYCFSSAVSEGHLKNFIQDSTNINHLVFTNQTRKILAIADFALCSAGTASLEAAVLDCPMLVYLKLSALTAFIIRRQYKGFGALPSIILNKKIVPELIQEDCTPANIAKEVSAFFNNPEQPQKIKNGYKLVREKILTHQDPYLKISQFLLKQISDPQTSTPKKLA